MTTNQYKPQSHTSEPHTWRSIECIVAALWIGLPFSAFVVRRALLPAFEDFGRNLPLVTQNLFHPYSPYLLAICSAFAIAPVFTIPSERMRRRFTTVAFIAGVILAVACMIGILILGLTNTASLG